MAPWSAAWMVCASRNACWTATSRARCSIRPGRSATRRRSCSVATRLGIARDEVMAVGDNFNDLEMLEFVGLPVVMGNSVPGLLERGWATTGDNEHAGLADAIRKYALSADTSHSS